MRTLVRSVVLLVLVGCGAADTSTREANPPSDAAPATDAGTDVGEADGAPDAAPDGVTTSFVAKPSSELIHAGWAHTCAFDPTKTLKCWGLNTNGQLGHSGFAHVAQPLGTSDITSFALGLNHTCVAHSTGMVECVGNGTRGQLGDGTTTSRTTMKLVGGLSGVERVSSRRNSVCASSAGALSCWGVNESGEAGFWNFPNPSPDILVPTPLPTMTNVVDVAVGETHACALVVDGTVRCWGGTGTWGDPTTTYGPVTVRGLSRVVQVVAGWYATCAVSDSGSLHCGGWNNAGQLGVGKTTSSTAPMQLVTSSGAASVGLGTSHMCIVTTAGEVKCVGSNAFGQLGNGTTSDSLSFVTAISSGAKAVACGVNHSCALMTNGKVKCWGRNLNGELGDTTTVDRPSPTDVVGF